MSSLWLLIVALPVNTPEGNLPFPSESSFPFGSPRSFADV